MVDLHMFLKVTEIRMLDDKSVGKLLWTGGQRQKDDDCKTPFVWKRLNGEMAFNYTY